MFGIGWGETIILLAAALIFLGPERLPGAIAWTLRSVRQVRDYAVGAADQLTAELGTEVEELTKPLAELNRIRGTNPREFLSEHLLGGKDSPLVFSIPELTPNFGIVNEVPAESASAATEAECIDPDPE